MGRASDPRVAQAKNYASKLTIRFAYSINGQGVYGVDMQEGPRELRQNPTPEQLWAKMFAEQNAWGDRFAAVPFED